MNNWDDLRYLAAFHKSGNMTAAAKLLNADPATVSRRLGRLSETLGLQLAVKYPDGWHVNHDLDELVAEVIDFESTIERIVNTSWPGKSPEIGAISLSAPALVCTHILVPNLSGFVDLYPAIDLTFNLQVNRSTLGESDLLITAIRPDSGRLIVRSIGYIEFDAFGFEPDCELNRWAGLIQSNYFLGSGIGPWSMHLFGQDPAYRLDTFAEVFETMRTLRLPGVLPGIIADDEPELVPLNLGQKPKKVQLYLCYHQSRRNDPLLRFLIDWVIKSALQTLLKHES